MVRSASRFKSPLREKMPNPNLARSSCLTSSRSTSWRATSSASKNLPEGRISRRHSQNVLLPVEMPPVIPIAGISGQCDFVFLASIRPRQHHARNTVFACWFMKIYEQPERNIQQLQSVHGGGSLHKR